MSLEDALARIPGIAGYEGARSANERSALNQIQQMSGIAALSDAMRKRALDTAYRDEISQAQTPEQQMAVAVKYGGPKDILIHADTQARIRATQEQAMARLAQTAQQFNARLETVKDENTRRRLKDQFDQYATRQLMAIRGAKAAYELPPDLLPSIVGAQPPASPGAPQPAPGGIPTAAQAAANIPPSDLAAFRIAQSGLGQGGATATAQRAVTPQEEAGMALMPGAPSAAPAPSQAPVAAPQAVLPPYDANLDARDRRSREMTTLPQIGPAEAPTPIPTTSAPGTPTPLAMPPEIARLPKREQDKWIAKNAAGAGSAAMGEDALKVAGWEKLLFGTDPKGLGNASAQVRTQIANERARIGKTLGLSDTEMAMMPQNNKVKMKAIDALTKWGAFVDKGAEQLIPSIDLAIGYAKKLDPTTLQTLNKAIIAGRTEFNDPNANAYAVAVNTVRREYGRLMSGPTSNAMLPVEAMKQGDHLISTALDVPAWMEVKNVIMRDAQFTRQAVQGQIKSLTDSISGPTGNQQRTPQSGATVSNW